MTVDVSALFQYARDEMPRLPGAIGIAGRAAAPDHGSEGRQLSGCEIHPERMVVEKKRASEMNDRDLLNVRVLRLNEIMK